MQTIVIGHKNPDMDSICSALGYARLKQLQGGIGRVTAARAGNTNARIDYVLKRFGFDAPVFLSDVSPKVSDVMQPQWMSVRTDSTVYEAIQLITTKQLRGLPVVDENNRCQGLLSTFALNRHMVPPREEAAQARVISASLAGIVETFGGSTISGELCTEISDYLLMVGAMNAGTFTERLRNQTPKQTVVFVGDREDIQLHAIQSRVRAIVVTGGLAVQPLIKDAATMAGVVIISSPHDTATSVLLARGAVLVGGMVEPFLSFAPETALETARERASESAFFVFPVVGEHGALVGVLSKSDFIKPMPRRLILVDHNELSQAVPGADKIPIVEILDHHRIGAFSTDSPIHFWNNPVGSTSTIVALCFEQAGIPIPADIAGLLMAGLIADTLNLSSPTATPVDKRVLDALSRIAGVDPAELAGQIFSVGSPLLTLPPNKLVTADCKEYEGAGRRFTVAQIEELNFSHLPEKQADLIEALEEHRKNQNLYFAALLVTDINTQNSRLLVCGALAFLERINYPRQGPNAWDLAGVVSRKKQLLPFLLQCLGVASR